MDKSTLSGYGWVIIVTLVLAVMLAFATPFGKYVGQGAGSVIKGFVGAGDNAMSEDNREALENEWNEFLNETTTGDCKIGDFTKDKNINENDYKTLKKVLNGYKLGNNDVPAADIDGDGDVDSTDLAVLGAHVGIDGVTVPSGTRNLTGTITARGPKNLILNSCTIGDINNDGKINVRDLGLLQQALHDWDVEISYSASDVNDDGQIDTNDLITLQNYLNGVPCDHKIGQTKSGSTKTIISNKCLVGDINEDGRINLRDAGLLQQFISGWEVPVDQPACDTNWDGAIDKSDYTLLIDWLNGGTGNAYRYINTIQSRSKKTLAFNTCVIGDTDQNGKYNLRDLGLIQQVINNWDITVLESERNFDLSACDINWDGKVDANDLAAYQKYLNDGIAGLIGTSKTRTSKTLVPQSILIGDANSDGQVTEEDVSTIQFALNGYDIKYNKEAADINRDGKVNLRDLGALQQWLEGINNTNNQNAGKRIAL